jgi:hypothetical protein
MSGSTSSLGGLPPEARTALERLAGSDPTAVADLNLALAPYTLLPQGGGTAAREPAARVDAPAADTFTSLLLPANNSGVLGAARAVFDEAAGTVTVDFRATGLTPGQEHALHIHGFSDDRPSLIPNAVLDADRDGFVEDVKRHPDLRDTATPTFTSPLAGRDGWTRPPRHQALDCFSASSRSRNR